MISVIVLSIHLAFYPIIVKAYEDKKDQLLTQLLEQNIIVLLLVSIIPGILFSFLVGGITQLLLGSEFSEVAARTIPIITLGAFFLGLKVYFFDLAFLLTHKTKPLLWIGI